MAVGMLAVAPSAVAQPLPLAFWSFDDGTSPTMDDTGNGNDGTLFGPPVYSTDVPAQIGSGNSLSFNGTSHYIALNMSFTGSGVLPQLTVSVWFKTTFSATGSIALNWAFLDFDRSENFNVYVTGPGTIGFSTTSSAGDIDDMQGATSGLNDGMWHHMAVVYDGSDKLIYVDGVLDGTDSSAHGGLPLGRGPTRYGFIGDGSEAPTFNGARNQRYYEGSMDEVAIWDVALTATDIEIIANGGSRLAINVDIDIKPGSDPNCFNVNGHGVIPVAILGSSTFDVTLVDFTTLLFGGLEVRVRGNKGPLCSFEDSDGDTILDLVCHFEDDSTSWVPGNGNATLLGTLLDTTTEFEGTDSICVVP